MRIIICIVCLCSSALMYGQSSNNAFDIIKKYQEASSIEDLQSTIRYKNISKKGRVQERSLEQYIFQKDASKNTYNFLTKYVSLKNPQIPRFYKCKNGYFIMLKNTKIANK